MEHLKEKWAKYTKSRPTSKVFNKLEKEQNILGKNSNGSLKREILSEKKRDFAAIAHIAIPFLSKDSLIANVLKNTIF